MRDAHFTAPVVMEPSLRGPPHMLALCVNASTSFAMSSQETSVVRNGFTGLAVQGQSPRISVMGWAEGFKQQ